MLLWLLLHVAIPLVVFVGVVAYVAQWAANGRPLLDTDNTNRPLVTWGE